MRKLIFFSLLIFLPTLCGAASDDPCYPDQVPVDTPEECHDITELSWGGVIPAETIAPGTTGQVTVLNGLPPFTFELEGSGFTIDASALHESRTREIYAGTCGAATITVTDACKKSVTGQVYTTNGSWQEVENYQGDCVIQGTLAENFLYYQGGYMKFKVIKGQYRLNQQTGVYESHHHCTSNVCDNCCSYCSTLPSEETFSCITDWDSGRCPYDEKISEMCITGIATTHGGCGAPGRNGCGDIYLMTRCFHHRKQLYEWTCLEDYAFL